MKNKEIKFKFDIHGMDEDLIERALKEMANSLNSYAGDGQDIYHFKDGN